MAFPIQRLQRMRQHEAFRCMVRETSLTPSDLIYLLFVVEGRDRRVAGQIFNRVSTLG
ncbi:MAG TPA: hypothetical protein VK901_13535 [Nitrospiraceae bacterium]|nr:hypothetical protein [Nitrospiraceae bacterium]